MFTKIKKKVNDSSLKLGVKAFGVKDSIKNRKGDTNLIVIVLLLGVVAVAVYLFQGAFMDILNNAITNLKDKFNAIWSRT